MLSDSSSAIKALQATLDRLDKTFGKGTVMKLGDGVVEGKGGRNGAGDGGAPRKMFKGELLSGNVLTENEVLLVGTHPTRTAITALVFQFSIDFHLSFSAGDLVLVPRSKGGLRCVCPKGPVDQPCL